MPSFEIEGLPKAQKQPNDGRAVFYHVNGGLLPIPNPPSLNDPPQDWSRQEQEFAGVVREGLNSLAAFEARRQEIKADKTLSPIGQDQKLSSHRANARVQMAAAAAQLEARSRELDQLEAHIFAAPRLNDNDLVGGLIDQELRTYVRSAKGEELDKAFVQMGNDPRLVEAVMRSPVPIPMFSEAAQKLWREHVRATNPQAARIDRIRETQWWAKNILPHIAQQIDG